MSKKRRNGRAPSLAQHVTPTSFSLLQSSTLALVWSSKKKIRSPIKEFELVFLRSLKRKKISYKECFKGVILTLVGMVVVVVLGGGWREREILDSENP